MEKATDQLSNNTKLRDRTLWFDGDSSFAPENLLRAMQKYDVKHVDEIDNNVREYNKHVSHDQELTVKTDVRPLSFEWNIPDEYKNLNIVEYVIDKHEWTAKDKPGKEQAARDIRLARELYEFEKRGLFGVLRAIIFVINTMSKAGTVWGVGRGSSVSSYVLYVIGVHDVDSFEYNLDIGDFLHN